MSEAPHTGSDNLQNVAMWQSNRKQSTRWSEVANYRVESTHSPFKQPGSPFYSHSVLLEVHNFSRLGNWACSSCQNGHLSFNTA